MEVPCNPNYYVILCFYTFHLLMKKLILLSRWLSAKQAMSLHMTPSCSYNSNNLMSVCSNAKKGENILTETSLSVEFSSYASFPSVIVTLLLLSFLLCTWWSYQFWSYTIISGVKRNLFYCFFFPLSHPTD